MNASYESEVGIDSLRLLQIEPHTTQSLQSESVLQCSLTTFSLGEAPEYVALSYAWYEPQSVQTAVASFDASTANPKHCISLHGKQTSVTVNLYCALHELCKHIHDTWWWIDALCIDQSNTRERTAQVTIMHKIFRGASVVYVWLGSDPASETYTVRELFRALLAKFVDVDLDWTGESKYKHGWLFQGDESTLLASGLPSRYHPIWKSVVRFWDRAWFNRVWVKQEVAVARNVQILCGSLEFTSVELAEASRFHIWSGLADSLMVLKPQPTSAPSRTIGGSAADFDDLKLFMNYGNRFEEAEDFKEAADRLCGPKSDDQHPLLRMFAVRLFLARRDDATDARDKIFALLMLMKQIAESNALPEVPLKIDYSKTKDDIYREATTWIIEESGRLGVLALLQPNRILSVIRGGYSWVPDFTCPPIQMLRLFMTDEIVRTDMLWDDVGVTMGPSCGDPDLQVYAKFLGTVADIGDSSDSMVIQGCFEMTARLLLNFPLNMANGLNRLEAWRRAMCGDISSPPDVSPDDTDNTSRAAFKEWLVWFILRKMSTDYREGVIKQGREHLAKMPSFGLLAETDEFVPKMLPDWNFWQSLIMDQELQQHYFPDHAPRFRTIETSGRRLFRIADPVCLGIGPEGMAPGDEIWIVVGCSFPVVLRRVDSSSGGTADNNDRLVVGEAYIGDLNRITQDSLPGQWQCLKLK